MKTLASKSIKLISLLTAFILLSVNVYGCARPASTDNGTNSDNSNADLMADFVEPEHDENLERDHSGVTFYKKYIEDIPVIDAFVNDGTEKKPVIFILHGYSGNKYYSVDLAVEYARNGYYAVIFDAYGHGERAGKPLKSFPEVMEMYPYDLEKAVNSLKNNPYADVYNMGMLGISMGACAIYKYCTFAEIKPKAITPLVGTPYYEQFMDTELSRSVYDEKSGNHEPTLTQQQLNTILAESSPYKNYIAMKDIAILMQQGETDDLVISQGAAMLYHDLKGIGAEDVNLIIHSDMSHYDIYDECFDNAFKFFEERLK